MSTGHHNEPELERRIRRHALMVGGFAVLVFVLYIVAVALKIVG